MADSPHHGSCQCGGIRYVVHRAHLWCGVCHCTECQKLSTSGFSITVGVQADAFEVLAGAPQIWSRIAESGTQVDCYFCRDCGNRIYHLDPEKPQIVRLKTGTLDDPSIAVPELHAFVRSKLPWVQIPEGVPTFAGQPTLEEATQAILQFRSANS